MPAEPAPGFVKNPDHRVELHPSPRRVRVALDGEVLVDTTRALLLRETRHTPVYYVPMEDARMDLMTPTDHHTYCPYKGEASYWTVKAGNKVAENAAWAYQDPYLEMTDLKDHLAFYWNKMDRWYEEDEEIFVHPRDPFKRVDVVLSHRPVEVVLGGETVARTTEARFLFETGLPTRYYIPRADVRMDLMEPSATRTRCPYKGTAEYFSARIGGALIEDIAWSYPDPIPECPKIKGLICFYNENVDAVRVDGVAEEKPKTKWSRS